MSAAVDIKPQSLTEQVSVLSVPQRPEPDWLQVRRQHGLTRLQVLGLPTRRQEAWRYVELGPVLNQSFQSFAGAAPTVSQDALSPMFYPEAERCRLVFINGRLSTEHSTVNELPSGMMLTDLQTALQQQSETLKTVLAESIEAESDPFVAYNTVQFDQGFFLYLADNVKAENPIQIIFITDHPDNTPRMTHPRGVISLGKYAKATVAVSFMGLDTRVVPSFLTSVVEARLAEGAQLDYSVLQAEDFAALHMASTRITLEKHSQANLSSLSFGGRLTRHAIHAQILGEGAHASLNGLSVLTGDSQVHDYTVIEHAVPHATSEQLYKGILDDTTRCEFDGTIVIHKDAVQTSSAQLNRNLLLSDDAKVYTRPQLQIDTDDVQCSHGATVGQLDEDQLFYLASRGLSPQLARSVLTLGFAEELVERLTIPSLRRHVNAYIERNLNDLTHEQFQEALGSAWSE